MVVLKEANVQQLVVGSRVIRRDSEYGMVRLLQALVNALERLSHPEEEQELAPSK